MSRQNPVRTLNCPNCGAPLNFSGGRDSVTCAYCNSVVERTDDAPNPAEEKHILRIDLNDLGEATVQRASVSSKRFVVRMRNGQPVVVDADETAADPAARAAYDRIQQARLENLRPKKQSFSCGGTLFVLVMVGIGPFIALMILLSENGVLSTLVGQINQITGGAVTVPQVFGSGYYVRGSAMLIPPLADTPNPDVLALTWKPGEASNQSYIVLVDGATQTTRWASEAISNDDYRAGLAYTTEAVFATLGNRVFSFDRATGATRWVNLLADTVRYDCTDCVRVLGNLLMVYTQDGTLQTFATSNGATGWGARAWSATAYTLNVLGDFPVISDYDEARRTSVLRLFDPTTGDETRVDANCGKANNTGMRLGTYSAMAATPDGTAFYLLQRGCAEKFTLPAGDVLWRTIPEGSFYPETNAILVTAEGVITHNDQQVLLFEAETGIQRLLVAENQDYRDYQPVLFSDNQLLMTAIRSRGTRRLELWAVEAATGARLWQRVLDDNESLAASNGGILSDGEYAWTTRLTPSGLWWLAFADGDTDTTHFGTVERLDWSTGASQGETRFNLGLDTLIFSAPVELGWTQNRYHWSIAEGGVLGVDVETASVVFSWKPR